MNKNIKVAVAGAVLALSTSAANAGIVIPAGEWTLDVSGNVNMYSVWANSKGSAAVTGGISGSEAGGRTNNSMTNGLLPNFLSLSASTRQNDLDVSWTISLQPGSSNSSALNGVGSANNGGLNNRQAFITFGDKSWGSVKVGKDLGIFGSDAILGDITLLGVGGTFGNATTAGNTTLGRIGSGYIYADWKPQIAYTTPNMSGFQATVGMSQAFKSNSIVGTYVSDDSTTYIYSAVSNGKNANVAYEGKASYSFAQGDVAGKVWVSGIAQHVGSMVGVMSGVPRASGHIPYANAPFGVGDGNSDSMAYAGDAGLNMKAGNIDFTAYGYGGKGIGTTGQFLNGYGYNDNSGKYEARQSYGGYVQAIYTLPTKSRVALSYGESRLDRASGETKFDDSMDYLVRSNSQWNTMFIHPLTKHLNLIAEFAHVKSENQIGEENKTNAGSLGAILFF